MLARAIQRIIERGMASGEFVAESAPLLARFITAAHLSLLAPADAVRQPWCSSTLQAFESQGLTAAPKAPRQASAGRRVR